MAREVHQREGGRGTAEVGKAVHFVDFVNPSEINNSRQKSPEIPASNLNEQLDEPIKDGEKKNKNNKSLFERTEDFLRGVQKRQRYTQMTSNSPLHGGKNSIMKHYSI